MFLAPPANEFLLFRGKALCDIKMWRMNLIILCIVYAWRKPASSVHGRTMKNFATGLEQSIFFVLFPEFSQLIKLFSKLATASLISLVSTVL